MPAGSSRALRLDPFALPIRFRASDAGADERVRVIELHRERVVLRQDVGGTPTAVNVPVAAFLGVALRVIEATDDAGGGVSVTLEHSDPELSIPLFAASNSDDVVAEWQSWAQALRMPLLLVESDGGLRAPFPRVGQVRVNSPTPRRRYRASLKKRRPSILLRRRPGAPMAAPPVHREREIIARN